MASIVLCASGSNAHGQLANGTLNDSHAFKPCIFFGVSEPGVLPAGTRHIRNIASGANHTLVVLERADDAGQIRSELWGCGDGKKGQLGPSYPKNSGSVFLPIELPLRECGYHGYHYRLVAAAWETTYVVLSCPEKNDILISMGANDFGDLGVGCGTQKGRPLHAVQFDNLIPAGTTKLAIESLNAGPHHVIVHLNCASPDGSAHSSTVGWGASRHGQLGNAMGNGGRAPVVQAVPQDISIMLTSGNAVVASGLGSQHSVFLHDSGRVSCLGSNRNGQIRGIHGVKAVKALGCTWNGTYLVVETDGKPCVLAAGSNSRGQLGRDADSGLDAAPVQFPFTAAAYRLLRIACGSEHVLCLFAVNESSSDPSPDARTEVWGWGWNEHGNLGLGMTSDVLLPTKLWPDSASTEKSQKRAVGIWAGCGTSWIVIER